MHQITGREYRLVKAEPQEDTGYFKRIVTGTDRIKLSTAQWAIQQPDATLSQFPWKVEGCVPGGREVQFTS